MGGIAGGRLAAAVSRAGGLGMIGMGSTGTARRLAAELIHVQDLGRPFGIGLVAWVAAAQPDLLDAAIAARPALLSVSFGEDPSWIGRARDAGIAAAVQVATADEAEQAVRAGVDVLVARGAEGGGHGHAGLATLPLLAAVLDRVDVPVLAAGGIASGRGLAAVLAAGAAGAWIGTGFAACVESLAPEPIVAAMLAAFGPDTVLTSVYDRALGYGWTARHPQRILRNDFIARWAQDPAGLLADPSLLQRLRHAIAAHDPRIAPVDAGQGVGLVRAARPAAEVVESLRAEAAALLGRWS